MKHINLNKRLQAIADCIDEGASVADVGTDHGYLPVHLALTGAARRIIGIDLSLGSLDTARRNASKYGVTDKVKFVNAPGLQGIKPADADTIVIAGIGGENIIGILSDAPWTVDACAAGKLKLILQPQTKQGTLHDFLQESGYKIKDESTVIDRGRKYTILVI